jgi:hypothetical protein
MPNELPDMAALLGLVFPSVTPERDGKVHTWTFTPRPWSYMAAMRRVREQAEVMDDQAYAANWLTLRSRQLLEYEMLQRAMPTDEQIARLLSTQYAEIQALEGHQD